LVGRGLSSAAARVVVVGGALLGAVYQAQGQGDSGFLRGKGRTNIALSYSLDSYDDFWIGHSKVESPPFGRVSRHHLNLYGAYGLTETTCDYTEDAVTAIGDGQTDIRLRGVALEWACTCACNPTWGSVRAFGPPCTEKAPETSTAFSPGVVLSF
jgi:hypothetical protein